MGTLVRKRMSQEPQQESPSMLGAGFEGPDNSAVIDAMLRDDVDVTELVDEDGGLLSVWLESEGFTGNLDVDDYEAGRAIDFGEHLTSITAQACAPSVSVLAAAVATTRVAAFDGEGGQEAVDTSVEQLSDSEEALVGATPAKTGSTYWWAADADASQESYESLEGSIEDAVDTMGGVLIFPDQGTDPLDDEDGAAAAVATRGGVLAGFADWAAELQEQADGYDELPVPKSEARTVARSIDPLEEHEEDYLFGALEASDAHPLWLGEVAMELGRGLPESMAALFTDPEAALAVWNGDGHALEGLDERSQDLLSTQLVLDLAAWTEGDLVTRHDLERFDWYLEVLTFHHVAVPELEGVGLSEALLAAAATRDTEQDPRLLRKRVERAFDDVAATYGELAGCEDVLERIDGRREGFVALVAEREAEAIIDARGGDDEVDAPMSLEETIAYRQVQLSAEKLAAAHRDITAKIAEAGAYGVDKVSSKVEVPDRFGGIALKTVVAVAASGDLKAQAQKLTGKPEDAVISIAKFTKAWAEAATAFGVELFRFGEKVFTALGWTKGAANLGKVADAFASKATGKLLSVLGVTISAAELAMAIRKGDPDEIAAAAANLAQGSVGLAETFGLVSMEGAMVLNILIIEAVGIYEIVTKLPKVAKHIRDAEVIEQSGELAEHYGTALKKLRRAEAAYAALSVGGLDQPVAHQLSKKCYWALAEHTNAVRLAFGVIREMPRELRDAFDGQLDRDASMYTSKPPAYEDRGAVHRWWARIGPEAKPMRRGIEDLDVEARLMTGHLGEVGAMAERAVLKGQREAEDAR